MHEAKTQGRQMRPGLGLGALVIATICSCLLLAEPGFAQSVKTTADRYEEAEKLRRSGGDAGDLQRSLELHLSLASEGYDKSLVRIASIYQQLEEHAQAIEYYTKAREAGSFFAAMRLADAHARGQFGDLSLPEQGFNDLVALTEQSDNQLVAYYLARAHQYGYGTEINLAKAIELYEKLGKAGHGQSLAKLGAIYADDDSQPADIGIAIEKYTAAAENGYDYALIALSELLIETGRGEEALARMNTAVENDVSRAEARRAIWHFEESFGPSSDKAFGQSELVRLAEAGNTTAARFVLKLHERRSTRLNELDLLRVLEQLQQKIENGDRLPTEAVARAYRELYWLIPNSRAKHAELVNTYGDQMGVRAKVAEQLEVLYDHDDHPTSRAAAYELLDAVEDEGYVYGLMRLRSIERTAFAYVLQKEFTDLGYYSGPIDGVVDEQMVDAMLQFCGDEGFYDVCIHGPMTYSSSEAIARAIYSRRAHTN